MNENWHQAILSNGLDYLENALPKSHLRYDEAGEPYYPNQLSKYVLLNLAAAIELILKARLCKEDWKLLFLHIEQANAAAFEQGNFQSVGTNDCMARLKKYKVSGFAASAFGIVKRLRDQRNVCEHLRNETENRVVLPILVDSLGFAQDFVADAFEPADFDASAAQSRSRVRAGLGDFKSFRETRYQKIESDLGPQRELGRVVNCLACGQETLCLGLTNRCLFCRWNAPSADVALQVAQAIVDYDPNDPLGLGDSRAGIAVVAVCDECHGDSLVVVYENVDHTAIDWNKCYTCGHSFRRPDQLVMPSKPRQT